MKAEQCKTQGEAKIGSMQGGRVIAWRRVEQGKNSLSLTSEQWGKGPNRLAQHFYSWMGSWELELSWVMFQSTLSMRGTGCMLGVTNSCKKTEQQCPNSTREKWQPVRWEPPPGLKQSSVLSLAFAIHQIARLLHSAVKKRKKKEKKKEKGKRKKPTHPQNKLG